MKKEVENTKMSCKEEYGKENLASKNDKDGKYVHESQPSKNMSKNRPSSKPVITIKILEKGGDSQFELYDGPLSVSLEYNDGLRNCMFKSKSVYLV